MTPRLRDALAHGRRTAWLRAATALLAVTVVTVGVLTLTPAPGLLLTWSAPFWLLYLTVLVLVAERPARKLRPVQDAWVRDEVTQLAASFGVGDDLALRWAKPPVQPNPTASLRTRVRVARSWTPNASHADGFATGSVIVLHPHLRKIPDDFGEAGTRFVLAHELAHAAHDTALLRAVPAVGRSLLGALLRGSVLSLFWLGWSGLPVVAAAWLGRLGYTLVTAWGTRRGEYACDRTALAYTGDPDGAGRVLDWLGRTSAAVNDDLIFLKEPRLLDRDAATWDPQVPISTSGWLGRVFDTHPPTPARIRATRG